MFLYFINLSVIKKVSNFYTLYIIVYTECENFLLFDYNLNKVNRMGGKSGQYITTDYIHVLFLLFSLYVLILTVRHNLNIYLNIGINGKMFDAIVSLYSDVECSVRVNNMYTDSFAVQQGVKQGCNLSPTLFSIYINDLANDIKNSNLGIDIDNYIVGILLYADDIVL